MPIAKYFSGHGTEVMKNMVKEYGKTKGKSVFYATMNKRKKAGAQGMVEDMMSQGRLKSKKKKS